MKNKLFIPLLVIAVIVRLLLAVTSYHPDVTAYTTSSDLLFSGHFLDLYDAVFDYAPNGTDWNAHQLIYVYQPLAYLVPAVFYRLVPNFPELAYSLLQTNPYATVGVSFFLPLLIIKLPFILADLLIAYLLYRLLPGQHSRLGVLIWLFSPVSLFVASIQGQIDTVLTLLLLFGYLQAKKGNWLWASVCFGLSALTKPIALVLIPLLAIVNRKNPNKLFDSLSGFLVYGLGILPFLGSTAYKHYVLFSDHMQKSLYAGLEIAPGTSIPLFFVGLALVALLLLVKKINLTQAVIGALLSSLVFTHFHPQWFYWVLPLLIIYYHRRPLVILITIASWLLIWLGFGSQLVTDPFFGFNLSLSLPTALGSTLIPLARSALVATYVLTLLPPNGEIKRAA